MKKKTKTCRRRRDDEDWDYDSFKMAKKALGISVASKIIKEL